MGNPDKLVVLLRDAMFDKTLDAKVRVPKKAAPVEDHIPCLL